MRIALWGNFGELNFGNECTLHAMLHNLGTRIPDASFVVVCNRPEDTRARHQVEAIPIGPADFDPSTPLPTNRFRRAWIELSDCVRAWRLARDVDALVVCGTGVISDIHYGVFDIPFQLFKWVLACRVRRRPVFYVSIGVEGLRLSEDGAPDPTAIPIGLNASCFSLNIRTKLLIGGLRLASYRSYRDGLSRRRIVRLWPGAALDPVVPDLAFSLPASEAASAKITDRIKVAVGIYAVEGSPQTRQAYIELIGSFTQYLSARDYDVTVVIGDAKWDQPALQDLAQWIGHHGPLRNVDIRGLTSFETLRSTLAQMDFVVATRFHNVLLSLELGVPCVSLSHMEKNDELMASMELSRFRLTLGTATLDSLVDAFTRLQAERLTVGAAIEAQKPALRKALDAQYTLIRERIRARIAPEAGAEHRSGRR